MPIHLLSHFYILYLNTDFIITRKSSIANRKIKEASQQKLIVVQVLAT
ncbi:MAG TPA: hypothetical protein VF487_05140 [Chitinophagaceae bacterium]